MQFAPRLSARLLDFIETAPTDRVPIAEINRRAGERAERLGLPRPSYQRVRELVHEARLLRSEHLPAGDILLDIALRTRSPHAYIDLATRPRRRRLRDRINK
jgi:hypothetical protein